MRKAVYIAELPSGHNQIGAGNPRVSQRSFFLDDVWDFTEEQGDPSLSVHQKKIDWDAVINGDKKLKDQEYAKALLSMKQLAYFMVTRLNRKPISIVARIRAWIRLLKFLSCLPYPITNFNDVTEYILNDYIEYLKSKPGRDKKKNVTSSTVAYNISCLNLLYDYKMYIVDALPLRPSGFDSPNAVAGFTHSEALMKRTEAIPDVELKIIIDWCLEYISNKSNKLLTNLEKFVIYAQELTNKKVDIKVSTRRTNRFWEDNPDFNSTFRFIREISLLRAACFIIIAFSTGMRVSEILSIKKGAIREEKILNHDIFYWIDSTLYKGQKRFRGTARSWMAGKKAAEAVEILEKLSSFFSTEETPYLFLPVMPPGPTMSLIEFKKQQINVMSRPALQASLNEICEINGIEMNLTPHRLRRSFARNIIRWTSTSIFALKDHLKHWSLYMTDWYIGLDPELIEDLEAERIILSSEIIEKICTENIGGLGGRKFMLELEKRIKNGTLPKEFRGKAGAEYRMNMIQSIHDSGLIAFPCTHMNFCVFQKDAALCTKGDFPKVNKCKPFECSNSFITEEHVPDLSKELDETLAAYNRLTESERQSPVGNYVNSEIIKIKRSFPLLLSNDEKSE